MNLQNSGPTWRLFLPVYLVFSLLFDSNKQRSIKEINFRNKVITVLFVALYWIMALMNAFDYIQVRLDEYDYSKSLEGQVKKDLKDHWRKHTLSYQDAESGEVDIFFYFLFILGIDLFYTKFDLLSLTQEQEQSWFFSEEFFVKIWEENTQLPQWVHFGGSVKQHNQN